MAALIRVLVLVCCWSYVTCACRHEYVVATQTYYTTECGITHVPTSIPDQTRQVEMNENNIATIRPEAFEHLSQCQVLYLHHNRLTIITRTMFRGMASLDTLYLGFNDISLIEVGSFSDNLQLRNLQLHYNKLTTVSMDMFTLDGVLPGNHVRLTLQKNPLQCDDRLCWIKEYEKEDRIEWVSSYRPECANFPGIKWENVTLNCSTTELPEITRPSTLQPTQHSTPQPTRPATPPPTKPPETCMKLEQHYVRSDINYQCFVSSQLKTVPTVFIPIQTTTLYLGNNLIQQLTKDSFVGLVHLEVLILSGNAIVSISPGVFLYQRNLIHLDLGENKLSSINGSIWKGLVSLKTLRITGNPLTYLEPPPFSFLPQLNLIYLDISQLVSFKDDLPKPSSYPNTTQTPKAVVECKTNSRKCDKSNCWLKKLEKKGFTDHYSVDGEVIRPNCSNLPGIYWDQVSLDCGSTDDVTQPIDDVTIDNPLPAYIYVIIAVLVIIVLVGACVTFFYLRGYSCKPKNEPKTEYNRIYKTQTDGTDSDSVYAEIDETEMVNHETENTTM